MEPDLVLFFGDINVDNIFSVAEIPEPGRDAYSDQASMKLGGAVCNSAVVLRGLGQPCAILGAVGNDLWADVVYQELAAAKVNTGFILRKTTKGTGLIFIAVTPDGERTMFSYRGANTTIAPPDLPSDLLNNVALVEFSGYAFMNSPQKDTAWRLLEMANAGGIPCSLDTGLDPVIHRPDEIKEVISKMNILITGREEAKKLTGKTDPDEQIKALVNAGLEWAAIKLGPAGAILGWEGRSYHRPAFPVKVKDTTGAGDAFSAGVVYGYLKSLSPEASMTLANILGGLATTVYGAARISEEDVLKFMENLSQKTEISTGLINEIRTSLL
jgi:ribokinase